MNLPKDQSSHLTRRGFIVGAASLAALTPLACTTTATTTPAAGKQPATSLPPNAVLVFQGDSITDAGRDRARSMPNDAAALGPCYVGMLMQQITATPRGAGFRVFNRGISGNRVLDLLVRWEADTLKLEPDLVSILVGVNDTYHRYIGGVGIKVPRYAALYRMLLEDTLERRPGCRLVLCEPFALPGGVFKAEWMDELRARMEVVRGLAKEFSAALVPFQTMFDAAMKQHASTELSGDGVHPTMLGHQLMARAWREAVGL